jgi:chromate transporter
VSLPELAALIFTYNLMTFGNGPVMVPLLQSSLVEDERVITQDQLLYAFTIARVTPGQANMYVGSIGYMMFGLLGAVVTTLVIQLPGYLILPMLRAYERMKNVKWVQGFNRGLTVTSVGLIFAATVSIGQGTLVSPVTWVVFALTLVMIQVLKWNQILSLGVATAIGIALYYLL